MASERKPHSGRSGIGSGTGGRYGDGIRGDGRQVDLILRQQTCRFSQQELINVINRGKKRQAAVILTTQKDAVRFPKLDRRDLPILFMRVEIRITRGATDFHDCVRQICFR